MVQAEPELMAAVAEHSDQLESLVADKLAACWKDYYVNQIEKKGPGWFQRSPAGIPHQAAVWFAIISNRGTLQENVKACALPIVV
jgi:hypothetical protein